jgi:methylated-DNA-[protein]-cysteine S-methyltransferase
MNDLNGLLRRSDEDRASKAATVELARAAEMAGLVDVAYSWVDGPLGTLLVAATRRGLVRVAYPGETPDEVLRELATGVSPRVLEAPAMLDEARRELDEYFAGSRHRFDIGVDFALTRGFTTRVLRATSRIPYGSVSSYKDVAGRAGNPRAYRAAGNALGSNPIPIVVPCHRVLHGGGGLGGYTGGLDRKRFLLGLEDALPT